MTGGVEEGEEECHVIIEIAEAVVREVDEGDVGAVEDVLDEAFQHLLLHTQTPEVHRTQRLVLGLDVVDQVEQTRFAF